MGHVVQLGIPDRQPVAAIAVAHHPGGRAVPRQPVTEAADRPGGGLGVKGDDLGVADHQADRLAVVVLVLAGDVHHQGSVLNPEVGDGVVQHPVEPVHERAVPDPTAGPEAAVAAFWLEVADILVLPTTSARADFNGALDYLEVGGLPPTVVAYIVPRPRRLRENPTTLEYVRAIRRRAISLVEIPDDANAVRLAGMEGVPVEQISPPLRLAYRELTETIAVMPRRPQG